MSLDEFLKVKEALRTDGNAQQLLALLSGMVEQPVFTLRVVALLGTALDGETHLRIGTYRKGLVSFGARPIELSAEHRQHPLLTMLHINYVYSDQKAVAYLHFIARRRFGKTNVNSEHFDPASFYSAQPLNTPESASAYERR